MAQRVLEPEVVEIMQAINDGSHFLLSGGAGSGKTYSLVHVIQQIADLDPKANIACITYTNSAVREIEERVSYRNLAVSTIHDFLWSNIKTYQKEIKRELIKLVNNPNTPVIGSDNPIDDDFFNDMPKGIQYKEWTKIAEGIISHDEVILLSEAMFKSYPLLCSIVKDRFQYILVDEYQDTSPDVIRCLLDYLTQSEKRCLLGFFGDTMQSIYDNGIGDIQQYVNRGDVREIKKTQNRRNPQSIIDLANQLRTDGIHQVPSGDALAPNMKDGAIKQGQVRFVYTQGGESNIDKVIQYTGWDRSKPNTRELILTHNLIAPRAGIIELWKIYANDPIVETKYEAVKALRDEKKNMGINEDEANQLSFDELITRLNLKKGQGTNKKLRRDILESEHPDLYALVRDLPFASVREIYIDRDSLTDDKKQDNSQDIGKGSKRDYLIRHLFKIQTSLFLYQSKQFNEFIRRTDLKIEKADDKQILKDAIEELHQLCTNGTIGDVIDFADRSKICIKDDNFTTFIAQNSYLFYRVKQVRYSEVVNLFKYLEGYTPYSTQHKVKGSEFDNVLVVLDNGRWTHYNFEQIFTPSTNASVSVIARTRKLFYVSCTRAKEQLVVYFHEPSCAVIEVAKSWFGPDNVVQLS